MFKVITISGSTRFKEEFQDVASYLEKKGCIVLTTHVFTHADQLPITQEEIEMYEKMYQQQIDMSSEVVVINKNGYIGVSTQKEIDYTTNQGKKVTYLYGDKDKNSKAKEITDLYNPYINY